MKRTSWIFLILLIIAIGIYFLIKYRGEKSTASSTEEPTSISYLVKELDGTLIGFRIFNQDFNIVALERNEEGFWNIILPVPGLADQSKATEAETQISALQIVTTIGQVVSFDEFGLSSPAYTISLNYSNETIHKIEVGNPTPTGSGYYVRVDNGNVFVVSKYSLDTILALITNPPYPATPTPTPTLDLPTMTMTIIEMTATPDVTQPTP